MKNFKEHLEYSIEYSFVDMIGIEFTYPGVDLHTSR